VAKSRVGAAGSIPAPSLPGSSGRVIRGRTTRAPETRRAQLLTAASDLFVENGIGSVSIADITGRAGLAKGTFYLYFESRDELLEALRADVAAAAVAAFEHIGPPDCAEDWPACLDRLVDGALDFFFENRELHDLLSREPHEHSAEEGEWPLISTLHSRLEQLISAGVEEGALVADMEVAPALVFELLHAAGHLLCDEADVDKVKLETRRMTKAVLLR
jgi:AcrR family transcriptional regulator